MMCPVKQTLLTRGRALTLAVVLAAGTAGCTVNSPFQTSETMSVGDGVPVDLEGLKVRNLALVGGEVDGDATVTGAVENTGAKGLTVTFTAGKSKVSTKVEGRTLVNLSEDKKVTLEKVKGAPGDMASIEVSTGSDSTPVDVPLLKPDGYYEPYAPEGWSPSASPSESESSESEDN